MLGRRGHAAPGSPPPRGSAGDSRLTPHYARGVPAVPKKGSKRRRSGTRHLAAESSVALTRTAAPDRDETRGGAHGRVCISDALAPHVRKKGRRSGRDAGTIGSKGSSPRRRSWHSGGHRQCRPNTSDLGCTARIRQDHPTWDEFARGFHGEMCIVGLQRGFLASGSTLFGFDNRTSRNQTSRLRHPRGRGGAAAPRRRRSVCCAAENGKCRWRDLRASAGAWGARLRTPRQNSRAADRAARRCRHRRGSGLAFAHAVGFLRDCLAIGGQAAGAIGVSAPLPTIGCAGVDGPFYFVPDSLFVYRTILL